MFPYIILIIFIILFCFYIYIYLLKIKIDLLEKKILHLFNKKNNLIPSLFEITKHSFIKHDEIFKQILQLRKLHFSEKNCWKYLYEILWTQKKIHNEINFIFKVSNKHPKLLKDWKFLYIRDVFLNKSSELWENIELYKNIISKFNFLIDCKNITIIWIFIPIKKKVL